MGGKTTTSTNQVTIPQDVLDRYNAVNTQAAKVAENPFQKYGTTAEDFVAQFNEQQNKGVAGINAVAGMGAAYENVDKYLNPYIKNVADTTRAQMEQAQEQAQSGALGTAVQSGAFGGDRAGVAAANLANQNQMAMGSTMANIYNQGYTQAIDTSMNDRNRMLGVAGAQLGAGTQMQQTEQAGLDALINQFQQEQGYPFQVAQFLANIAMGTGALSGSTTTTTQPAQIFSDRRLKHDIKKIGEADNGLPIYTFKYKGDEHHQTHVGFMADEVEKKNPDAVGLDPSGYKTVDYDKAAQSMGGGVHAHHKGEAFADGGVAGPYSTTVGQGVGVGSYVPQAYLPVGELMMADPAAATAHQSGILDALESAASMGKSVVEIRDMLNNPSTKTAGLIGGGAGRFADGGGVKPQVHGDYMSSTLAAQEAGKDKPELKVAGQQGQQGSALGNIASTIGSVATIAQALPIIFSDRRLKHDIKRIGKTEKGLPIYTFKYKGDDREQTHVGFMADEVARDHPEAVGKRDGYKTVDYSQAHKFADGGVAGRHGYALDGAVEERLRDAMRRAAAAENGMRLTSDEVPAAQTLNNLPDANVVAAEAPASVPPSGYVGPNSRAEAEDRYRRNEKTGSSAADVLISRGIIPPEGVYMPPRPTAVATEMPTGVAPVVEVAPVENDMTLPEYLSSFRLNERIPAGLASIGNIIAAPIAGAVGIGAGLAGAPEFGNAAMNFAGDRIDDWKEASLAALGTDSQIAEMYRRSAAENLAAENDAANQAIAAAPLTVDQRPRPRPVEGGVAAGAPGVEDESARFYRMAAANRFNAENAAPTGVAPVEGQMRPRPRPEGLGAANVAAPVAPVKPPVDTRRKIASVIGGGDGFTDVVYTDGTKDRVTGNLNFRNNNPGNMEYGDLAKKYGAVGTDGRFAVFPDYETGRKAQEALLFESGVYEGKTIGSAIAKYAPLGDGNNDPVAYANNVAAALGVPVDTPLSALNPEQRNAMLTAMEKQEGGGGLSTFSTTPLGADGRPVPLQGGVAGGAGQGTVFGAGSEGRRGGVKPYEERNALGRVLYDEDGRLNKNAMLSLFAGLGDMLSSPSPFLLPAIGAGVAGAAKTYMAREGQLADIAKTQAETNRTNILAESERFFTVGQNGMPLVTLLGGGTATLDEFLSNPSLRASADPEVEAQVRAAAQEKAASESGTVFGTEMAQDALERERSNSTVNYATNQAATAEMLKTYGASSEVARASMPSLLNQVKATANLDSSGVFQAYQNEAFRVINEMLQAAGQPTIETPSDAQILAKSGVLRSLDMASGSGQSAAQALDTILAVQPGQTLEPETNAKIMASLMLANQRSIDMNGFIRQWQDLKGNSARTTIEAPTLFGDIYGRQYISEERALENIVLNGSQPINDQGDTILSVLSGSSLSPDQKNQIASAFLLAQGMSEDEIKNIGDISRYFGG